MASWTGNRFLTAGTNITITAPDAVGLGGATIAASGGGGGGILSASATLTNAEVIALPTSGGVEIVPAVVGALLLPIAAILYLDWHADYTGIDAGATLIVSTGRQTLYSGVSWREDVNSGVSSLLAFGESSFGWGLMQQNVASSVTFGASGIDDPPQLTGHAIKITAINAGTNFGGGDANNALQVTVLYMSFSP